MLKILTVSSATASLFGTAFIMLTFHLMQTRSLMMHVVYALSFSDLVTSVVYIVSWNAISAWDGQLSLDGGGREGTQSESRC